MAYNSDAVIKLKDGRLIAGKLRDNALYVQVCGKPAKMDMFLEGLEVAADMSSYLRHEAKAIADKIAELEKDRKALLDQAAASKANYEAALLKAH